MCNHVDGTASCLEGLPISLRIRQSRFRRRSCGGTLCYWSLRAAWAVAVHSHRGHAGGVAARGNADCWVFGFSWDKCCAARFGAGGNQACWDGARYTYAFCCKDENTEGARLALPNHQQIVEQATAPTVSPVVGNESSYELIGDECWSGDFSWETCCSSQWGPVGNTECWNAVYKYERCCLGIVDLPSTWQHLPAWDPIAQCLLHTVDGGKKLRYTLPTPESCSGRYYYVAKVSGVKVMQEAEDQPWWSRPKADQNAFPTKPLVVTRPLSFGLRGGVCVPSSCGEEAVATWLVPLVAPPWQDSYLASPVEPLNDTHVRVPPKLAAPRQYKDFGHTWVASMAADSASGRDVSVYEFAIDERRAWQFDDDSIRLVLALIALVSSASVLFSGFGMRHTLLEAFDVNTNASRLCAPRGLACFDYCRAALTLGVVLLHVVVHGRWDYRWVPQSGITRYAVRLVELLGRVNTSFTVLSVSLSLRRAGTKGCVGSGYACLWHTFKYILRRFLGLAPWLALWSYVYLEVFLDDIPLRFFESHGLYVWYGSNGAACRAHLWSSSFLVHDLMYLESTSCHNLSIFEGLFQIDVFIFVLLAFGGSKHAGVLAALLWPGAVILHWCVMGPHNLTGRSHRFFGLLPGALATCVFDRAVNVRHPVAFFKKVMFGMFCALCIIVTSVLDALNWEFATGPWTDFFKNLHPTNTDYCVWGHVYELPHVLGLVLFLRLCDQQSAKSEGDEPQDLSAPPWLTVWSRLSGCINLANLFVIHVVDGYIHEEPTEMSLFAVFGKTCAVLICSFGLSLFVYLTVEAPCSRLASFALRP